jgi:hypothetical protein
VTSRGWPACALRRYLDDKIHVRVGRGGRELFVARRGVGAAAGWKTPAGGWNVDFVDVDVRVNR